jgi:predicted transposase YdaD
MAVLRESPWYQEILREGEQRRLQRERSLVLKLLARKVGALSPEMLTQVEALSIDQMEILGEALLDFTQPEDLTNWLERNA